MIYVDELRTPPCFAPRCFLEAGNFCHLMADSDAELEAFARRLGLNKAWRHGDHYDLTPARRAKAVQAGAVEVTSRDLVRIRREAQTGGTGR